ncbi:MAG: NAD(P)/FAD-dependent oxidoreductase [Candidatus Promineifilaceae bacterium]
MKTDVVIIGGGPAGATAAMYLLREGIKPIIIEKETFPRFHIGESMTGECGAIVRELGFGDEMLKQRHPIKHGVKVFGKNPWFVPVMSRNGEGNLEDQVTWQVRRSNFDKMMLDEAVKCGATLIPGKATRPLVDDEGAVYGVEVDTADGGLLEINSQLVLDCSGLSTFLARAGVTGPKYMGHYDRQIAIFSQIANGIRDDGDTRDTQRDNTLIFYKGKYHWAWWIPLDDEVVSVGIVSQAAYYLEKKESRPDFVRRELHELHPELKRRVPDIRLVEEARAVPNYSYQVARFCGKGYICIGDAHRFVDPIFSFGLFVSMKEAKMAVPYIVDYLAGANRDAANPFAEFQLKCEHGIDILEDALDGFWEHPFAFAWLVHDRHKDDMIDVFAGRVYENQPSAPIIGFRKLLDRTRSYESEDTYSLPIGSRYQPDRAPLWEESYHEQ